MVTSCDLLTKCTLSEYRKTCSACSSLLTSLSLVTSRIISPTFTTFISQPIAQMCFIMLIFSPLFTTVHLDFLFCLRRTLLLETLSHLAPLCLSYLLAFIRSFVYLFPYLVYIYYSTFCLTLYTLPNIKLIEMLIRNGAKLLLSYPSHRFRFSFGKVEIHPPIAWILYSCSNILIHAGYTGPTARSYSSRNSLHSSR